MTSSSWSSDSLTNALLMSYPALLHPIVPDGFEPRRQRWHAAQVDLALAGAVEIGTAGGQEAVMAGHLRVFGVLVGCVAAGDDLDGLAAQVAELFEQRVKLRVGVFVAPRVGNRCPAACRENPAHGLLQGRPLHGHVGRLAVTQIAVEDFLHGLAM